MTIEKTKARSGIYCIENSKNKKRYIGQTTDLRRRKLRHFLDLEKNSHYNKHLQGAYNKYGKTAFEFNILIYCEPFELTKYEQFFVNFYTPEILYNERLECVDSSFGIKRSKETKRKMSESHVGFLGKNHSKEAKRKISKTIIEKGINKGEKNGMYGKTGEKNPFYGKQHTEEFRKEQSLRTRGENHRDAKLKKEEVLQIRKFLDFGEKISELAKKYNVSVSTISSIKNYRTWKHI